jgi:hypothetical protein
MKIYDLTQQPANDNIEQEVFLMRHAIEDLIMQILGLKEFFNETKRNS